TFDFVNFAAVLEHVADPAAAVSRALGWMKPGAIMHIEVPSSAYLLSTLVSRFYKLSGANFVINTCPMHVPYHLYEFGLDSFIRHGSKSGYTVAFHGFYPCAGYMPKWMKGPFNKFMKATKTGMQLAVWLRKDGSQGA